MRWQPLADAETDALLDEARPVAAALAVAAAFADGGGRIRRGSLVRTAAVLALAAALWPLSDVLGGWTWILGGALLPVLLDGFAAGRAAAQGLGADLDALRAAGRGLPEAALPGQEDLVLRIRDGAGAVGRRGSAHARLETAAALDAGALPPAWAAWVGRAGNATILRLDGRLLVLDPDGAPRAFRPSPQDLRA